MWQFQICICWIFFFEGYIKSLSLIYASVCMQVCNTISQCQNIDSSTCDDSSFKNCCQLWCKILQYIFDMLFIFHIIAVRAWNCYLTQKLPCWRISPMVQSITGTHFDLVHVGPCKCPEISVSEKRSYDIPVFIPILSIWRCLYTVYNYFSLAVWKRRCWYRWVIQKVRCFGLQ